MCIWPGIINSVWTTSPAVQAPDLRPLGLFRKNRGRASLRVKLTPHAAQKAEVRRLGLPLELIVRFVSLRLPTGELEVLVTSLLDEVEYPTQEFLEVYHWRWNHETFITCSKAGWIWRISVARR